MQNIFLNSRKLPLIIKPKRRNHSFNALIDVAVSNKDVFVSQLLRHGALLFRGFEIDNEEQFSEFVKKFSGKEFFDFAEDVSTNNSITNKANSSTENISEMMLELHNEFSCSAELPQNLYFFCETAPQKGGETILGDCRRILRGIRPKIAGLFKHKKVLYEQNLCSDPASPISWQSIFETEDKTEVEEKCRKSGNEFEWKKDDILVVKQICSAVTKHSKTSEDVWFNQAYFAEKKNKSRLNSFFGDGSPICVLMLEHIRKVLRKEAVSHRWEKGDVLILDNILTAHGRMPYSGERKILLAMT